MDDLLMTSAHFPLATKVEFHDDDPNRVTLLAPFVYIDPGLDIRVDIPAGFVSDGNSVPKAFQGYFGRWECVESGLVHDWLYDNPGAFSSHSRTPPLSRGEVDSIHRRILELKGFRWTKRQLLYGILRSCGFLAWNRHRSVDTQPVVVETTPTTRKKVGKQVNPGND